MEELTAAITELSSALESLDAKIANMGALDLQPIVESVNTLTEAVRSMEAKIQ